jgi:hypothetical protein
MKQETYAQARKRLHAELVSEGYIASSPTLKILWVDTPSGRISFRTQAVYLDGHSMFYDIRGVDVRQFLIAVAIVVRSRCTCRE